MQLERGWEKHLLILTFLLQLEIAFSPGASGWTDSLLLLAFTDPGAVTGEYEPLGTWPWGRGMQGSPPREAGSG